MNNRFMKIIGLAILAVVSLGLSSQNIYKLDFNPKNYVKQTVDFNGKSINIRAYEHVVYVSNPVDTSLQVMNIYIPEAYLKKNKTINGYTAKTAPIFFPNKIGGYMEAKPATAQQSAGPAAPFPGGFPQGAPGGFDGPRPDGNGLSAMGAMPGGMNEKQQSVVAMALSKGYIVASAGARGRKTSAANGSFTGKAPSAIVDLKAAIRYLKFNDKVMPGDAKKIISNGTSAGGAMSALLGATGNNPDYESYLTELGAAPATDDIFAVSAYCPITNLDHADMAYEWQFNGINEYKKHNFGKPDANSTSSNNQLSIAQISLSNKLKEQFPDYVNSLGLKDSNGNTLELNKIGEGNFREYVKSFLIASAQKALNEGKDLSKFKQLKIEKGKVVDIDWQAHINYMGRMKTPPAFDGVDLATAENQVFGDSKVDYKHFTEFGKENTTKGGQIADPKIIKMMNPMYYIGDAQTKSAPHWRIRHGTNDKDTGLGISVILGTTLQNKGYDVNLALPWDRPHSGDYDLDELFNWTDSICK